MAKIKKRIWFLSALGLSVVILAPTPGKAYPRPVQPTVSSSPALTVRVTSPNGGEIWTAGEKRTITWAISDNAPVTNITIRFSAASASPEETVASLPGNSDAYEWHVPDISSATCLVLIEVTDASGNRARDQSDKVFTIIKPATPEPRPDLVASLESTKQTAPRQEVFITVTVKNAGTGPAPESLCEVIIRNKRPPRQLLRKYQERIPDLVPGGMFSYTFPVRPGLGFYELCAVADSKKQVTESDERNNQACITLEGKWKISRLSPIFSWL